MQDKLKENCCFYTEIPNKQYDVIFIAGKVASIHPYLKYIEDIGRGIAVIG